jgi:hypothetical protein
MAPRGRPPGFVMTEEHRTKISNSQILNRLLKHFDGEVELNQTQVTVGLALLKKVLPDLSNVQHSGDQDNPINHVHRIERVVVDPKK